MPQTFIAYYRVSTKQQGLSGLGLDAQRFAVNNFLKAGDMILKEFTEIESGKNNVRPVLASAVAFANKYSARLIIAKLDRLSRDIGFIFTLRNSGVDFTCADIPEANTLTIGIFATMAQYEREQISERTKKALAIKKLNGFKLGSPQNLTYDAALAGALVVKGKARKNENNRRATAMIMSLRNTGYNWIQIASYLNAHGFRTSEGKNFQSIQVQRLFKRTHENT